MPPSPAAVRGDGSAAVHRRDQRAGCVGQGGLEYNEPSSASPFKSLPGVWSNLALACLIHMGMKRLTLDEDSGLLIRADFA